MAKVNSCGISNIFQSCQSLKWQEFFQLPTIKMARVDSCGISNICQSCKWLKWQEFCQLPIIKMARRVGAEAISGHKSSQSSIGEHTSSNLTRSFAHNSELIQQPQLSRQNMGITRAHVSLRCTWEVYFYTVRPMGCFLIAKYPMLLQDMEKNWLHQEPQRPLKNTPERPP